MKKNPLSFQVDLNPEDFLPATEEEKQSQVVMRESVSFWKDGFRRLKKNKVAMVSICLLYTSPSPRDRQKSRMPSSA